MKIALLGAGNIAHIIAEHASDYEIVCVYDVDEEAALEFSKEYGCRYVNPTDFPKVDLVVEAASQKAVSEYAKIILDAGQNLMVMSVGAFVNVELFEDLGKIAKEKGTKLVVPSGAIAGLDGIKSAKVGRIDKVTLTTTKPPKGLGLNLSEAKVIFEGSATEAVKKYPKNVNVAATLSLVALGFDKTKVRIVADPKTDKNTHEINVKGEFGELCVTVQNVPSPNNPKTSFIAAMSAVSAIRNFNSSVLIG